MQQATAPRECLVCIGIKTRYIETGSPWRNGCCERDPLQCAEGNARRECAPRR